MFSDMKSSIFLRILTEICSEQQISLKHLSRGWLHVLKKSGKTHYIFGYKFELNPAAAAAIADDKFATYEVLKSADLPVIDHEILYHVDNHAGFATGHNTKEFVQQFWQDHNQQIVIKPNDGTCGRNVLRIQKLDEIEPALERIFLASYSASLCPFVEILREYRTVLLDNEPRLVYAKERGRDWHFNLSRGAESTENIDPKLREQVIQLASTAAQAINLRFCSVDIVETVTHELLIMEVNSGVMIKRFVRQHPEVYDKVKAIYRDAIEKMFIS